MSIAQSNAQVERSTITNVIHYRGRFVGAGAAVPTVVSGGRGITWSRQSQGNYTLTFSDVGEHLLNCTVTVGNTAGNVAGQKQASCVAYSASAKTMTLFVTDLATPSAVDFASGDIVFVDVCWSNSDKP